MSKELDEAWTTICHYNEEIIHDMGSEYVENPLKEEIDIVNNALLELKAIREANPSEALKRLEKNRNAIPYAIDYRTIKQALIKAQEQEKVLSIIKEKRINVDLFWKDFVDNRFDYNYYLEKWYKYQSTDKQKLTQKEFDLLMRWLG